MADLDQNRTIIVGCLVGVLLAAVILAATTGVGKEFVSPILTAIANIVTGGGQP